MLFLKRLVLGVGALIMILLGGAGTQTQSTLLQGGGFLGLIIGLVVLYIFAKMAWRAMGCLPSLLVIVAVVVFMLYAIGAFNGGVGNVGQALQEFFGRGQTASQTSFANLSAVGDTTAAPIGESLSAPGETAPQQAPAASSGQGFLNKLLGGKPRGFNPQDYPVVYSTAKVVSGDMLEIQGYYFRLFGIDAPELNQTCADQSGRSYHCGQQAAAWLRGWLQDNELECRVMSRDGKGNMLGVCSLGAYDLGAALVNAGWAVVYAAQTDIYLPYQEQAQENLRGLWQGEFYMPWDWRKIQSRKPKIKIIEQEPKRKRIFMNPFKK